MRAAEATECAFDQSAEKGWAYRERIYQNQEQLRQSGANSVALLKTWAGQTGVDQAAFDSCLDSGRFRDRIEKEKEIATQLKVPGTPSIFVGDQLIRGAGGGVPTVEEIGKAVDQVIAQKQGR